MDKQCKEWCLINHPENKSKWIWKVSMFRNVHHNLTQPCLKKMASSTWRYMPWINFIEKILWNDVSHTLTLNFLFSNSLWLLSLSCFATYLSFERKMNSRKLRLFFNCQREDAICFLGRRSSAQIKTLRHVHWKRFIHLSFSCGLFFR